MRQRAHSPTHPIRKVLASVAACAALAGTACREEAAPAQSESESEDLTIVVEADKSRLLEAEAALSEKREAVEGERERLARERQDIEQKLASLSKQDRKSREQLEAEQARIADEQQRLLERSSKFESERAKLEKEKSELLDRIATLTKRESGGMTIEQREADVARREKDVAQREAALAQAQGRLAGREAEATATLKELSVLLASLQGGAGVTKTVIVNSTSSTPAAPAASKTHASRVEKTLEQKMDAKGILMEDLPPTAKSLFEQGTQAMSGKEYDDAVAAFEQVQGIVDGIAINQSFVQGKMARLNRAITSKELDDKKKQKVQGLLAEVSDAAADGRYDRANKKANQIALVLRSKP